MGKADTGSAEQEEHEQPYFIHGMDYLYNILLGIINDSVSCQTFIETYCHKKINDTIEKIICDIPESQYRRHNESKVFIRKHKIYRNQKDI